MDRVRAQWASASPTDHQPSEGPRYRERAAAGIASFASGEDALYLVESLPLDQARVAAVAISVAIND